MIIKTLTNGVSFSAIINCLGPVHKAYGIISPAKIINMTEISTAKAGGTTLSKNIGNDSIQKALPISNVQSNMWCYLMIGRIVLACLCYSFVP